MHLIITYDENTLSNAPAAFFSAVNDVVNVFESTFTGTTTVNIQVGYGNFPLDTSVVPALGLSQQNTLSWGNYSQVRQALTNEGAAGATTLPASSPINGGLVLSSAEEKALGLMGASNALDGWIGIASDATVRQQTGGSWSFDPITTPGAHQYDIVGTIEHEIAHVMGRTSYLDVPGEYGLLDLYRYGAPGVHQTDTDSPSYFSVDNGATNLANYNMIPGADDDDWASSAGPDAFLAFSPPGQLNRLTSVDITVMNALGWGGQAHTYVHPIPVSALTDNPPANVLSELLDFDGNHLGSAGSWHYLGQADIQGDGDLELIYTNPDLDRWATLGPDQSDIVDLGNHGAGGDTRIVGVYIDPLIPLGIVQAGSAVDSQMRFEKDLHSGNVNSVLGFGDFNSDGLQEVYFGLKDHSAVLHAYMHADGNIQYANYQSFAQAKDYLLSNGHGSDVWGTWFS